MEGKLYPNYVYDEEPYAVSTVSAAVVAFVYSIYPYVFFGVYYYAIELLGIGINVATWLIGTINFALYLPVGIKWIFTCETCMENNMSFRKWSDAASWYGWILAILNWIWYIVLIVQV